MIELDHRELPEFRHVAGQFRVTCKVKLTDGSTLEGDSGEMAPEEFTVHAASHAAFDDAMKKVAVFDDAMKKVMEAGHG